jgi:hypothetical protein
MITISDSFYDPLPEDVLKDFEGWGRFLIPMRSYGGLPTIPE